MFHHKFQTTDNIEYSDSDSWWCEKYKCEKNKIEWKCRILCKIWYESVSYRWFITAEKRERNIKNRDRQVRSTVDSKCTTYLAWTSGITWFYIMYRDIDIDDKRLISASLCWVCTGFLHKNIQKSSIWNGDEKRKHFFCFTTGETLKKIDLWCKKKTQKRANRSHTWTNGLFQLTTCEIVISKLFVDHKYFLNIFIIHRSFQSADMLIR